MGGLQGRVRVAGRGQQHRGGRGGTRNLPAGCGDSRDRRVRRPCLWPGLRLVLQGGPGTSGPGGVADGKRRAQRLRMRSPMAKHSGL